MIKIETNNISQGRYTELLVTTEGNTTPMLIHTNSSKEEVIAALRTLASAIEDGYNAKE